MQYFELRLTLMDGKDLFIRDHRFVIHIEERKRKIKALGEEASEFYYATVVNGHAVMESYDEVIAMLKDQK